MNSRIGCVPRRAHGRCASLPVYRNQRRGIAWWRIKVESGNHAPKDDLISSSHPPRPGPCAVKGLGEGGVVAVAPAVASAIYQATGVRIKELPLTPERVWRALHDSRG